MGWNLVQQVSNFYETWVITRTNNREPIERVLPTDVTRNIHFIYFDLPRWMAFWKRGRRGLQLYYYLWQLGAYFAVRKLHREIGFDLVHHVTFVKYWAPSFLALLPLPFLWGPVGGAESAPLRFWFSLSFRGKLYELLRYFVRGLAKLDPFVRLTAQRAVMAMATTRETEERLRALGCRRVFVFPQVALPGAEIRLLGGMCARMTSPFRVVSIGYLMHFKGFDLGLRAFARFHREFPASEYWLIGEGPERGRLERLARELDVTGRVTFWGSETRTEVLEKLADCDVLLHPALHESGGLVSLEAMAAGRPVICLDLGGLALQVTEDTGIRVPAVSPQQAVAALAAALSRIARDPCLRASLARAGRERVQQHFNWERKGLCLASMYDQVSKNCCDC